MDLYKYAQRFAPIVGSGIVRSAFTLAKDIRTVDMQTAPYDLADLGVVPIPVETQAGRDKFAELQLGFAQRAQTLRTELITALKTACVSAEIKG
jgi:predicted DNA-binding transcriptional regulator YafY